MQHQLHVHSSRVVWLWSLLLIVGAATTVRAQTASFAYQGRLTETGTAATGIYDLQFRLFDGLVGGNQVGITIISENVSVTTGSFSVLLDFGAASFPGANRYLEIGVRPGVNTGEFTILNPLQPITATPYALQSLNATNATTAQNALQLGGVAANQYVLTSDARLTDSRAPTAGSTNYIQSNPVLQQAANFNISGNGTLAGTLSANSVGAGTTAPNTPLDLAGAFSVRGSTAPAIAPSGQGRLYFDAILNKFRVSQNGAGFTDLVGGVSGSGTTGVVPLWSTGTAIGNSIISQSGSNVVIGATGPSQIFDVQNSAGSALIRIRSTGSGGSNLFLDRAAAISSISSQIGFFSAGLPDFAMGTSQGSAGDSDFSIYNYGIADNAFTILKSNGNIGIGTTNPVSKLHVLGNSVFENGNVGIGTPDLNVFAKLRVVGTGLNTAVRGESDSNANGVLGINTSTGAGVHGNNTNSGPGVFGESIGGFGVFGQSTNGYGLFGQSTSGYGVSGQTSSIFGAGVRAQGSGIDGIALQIESGAIRVPNAGVGTSTAVFIHRATANNTSGAGTIMSHPMIDGNPNVILFVTPNAQPGGCSPDYPIAVHYINNQWHIAAKDVFQIATIPLCAAFNVLIVKP